MRMNKNRVIAVILSVFVVLAFCGCDRQEGRVYPKPQGVLVIGTDEYEPYNYLDYNGEYIGIDIDIAREACKRIGYTAEFKRIKWDEKNRYLEDGEIDCIWSCFTMNGREDKYLWAGPYLQSNQVVIVRASSDIDKLKDLEGKSVAIQSSTKPEQIFLQREAEKIPEVKKLYCFVNTSEAVAAFKKGYVDACAGHELALQALIRNSDEAYRILDEPLMKTDWGVAFLKNHDPEVVEKLNAVLQEMQEDGTISSILQKYNADYGKRWGGR